MILKELTEFYMPEKILHREDQIKEIKNVFKQFKEFGTGSNLLLCGFSGSGKTTVINNVLSEQENNFIFVSGSQQITAHQILRAITDMTFTTRERLLSEAIRKFRNHPTVIIIDEINKLKRVEEIRWLFNDLNTLFRETGCPIIVITNMREILKIIPKDAKLTLFFKNIEFKSYNPDELRDIIEERINLIKQKCGKEINFPEEFLPYICLTSSREGEGSARLSLFLVKECILSDDFSRENIERLIGKLKQGEWEQFISDLPDIEKRFLSLLIYLVEEKRRFEKKEILELKDILRKIKTYPPQRISQLINSLEGYGIIEKARIKEDKRTKCIKFISEDIYEKLNKLTGEIVPLV